MNEVILNTNEIESIWEKDNLCFVKMKSGKVWLCEDNIKICHSESNAIFEKHNTKEFISNYKRALITLPLSQKGKSE